MHVLVALALVAALAAFVVGILTATLGWVIASIALSAVALLLIVRGRPRSADRAARGSGADAARADDDNEADDAADDESDIDVGDDRDDDTADAGAAPAADLDEVWVIDGRPRYHLGECSFLADKDAEPVPLQQAIEDGFTPCSICSPPRAA